MEDLREHQHHSQQQSSAVNNGIGTIRAKGEENYICVYINDIHRIGVRSYDVEEAGR
jgi:hypothetical protein